MERLQLLIFSRDSSLVGLVRSALQDLGVVGGYFDTDSTRVFEVLRSRHFDGIILDCNELACALEILTRIRRTPANSCHCHSQRRDGHDSNPRLQRQLQRL